MDNKNFDKAMVFVFKWEGGEKITNDPSDPGGLTKYGISKRAHPSIDVANLTEQQAKDIYLKDYWIASGAKNAEWPACLAIMDTAVNMGVSKAISMIGKAQKISNPILLALDIIKQRETFYNNLATKKPTMKKYLKGWLNRINDLKSQIQ